MYTLLIPAPEVGQRSKATGKMNKVAGWLSMNDRFHWRSTAARKKGWQAATRTAAEQVGLPMGYAAKARFEADLMFRRAVRRDPINWHPTVKPCIDELVSLGFLRDDTPQYLHCQDCPHLRLGDPLSAKDGFKGLVVLKVEIMGVYR